MKVNAPKIKFSWFTIAILLGFWLLCASFYPSLPDQVPTHWNFQGQPDGYSSKAVASLIMPLLPLGLYIFLTLLPKIDPKKDNYGKFALPYEKIRTATVLVIAGFTALPILTSLGYNVNISLISRIAVPLLIILNGNYLGKIRYNYFTGIKTPWTLASEEVWNKTHRVGGRMMVVGGFVSLLSLFTPPTYGMILMLAGLLVPAILAIIYSYILYRKIAK